MRSSFSVNIVQRSTEHCKQRIADRHLSTVRKQNSMGGLQGQGPPMNRWMSSQAGMCSTVRYKLDFCVCGGGIRV